MNECTALRLAKFLKSASKETKSCRLKTVGIDVEGFVAGTCKAVSRFIVVRAIYYSFFKGIENVGIGGLSVTTSDLMSNSAVLQSIADAVRQLEEKDWEQAII